MSASPHRADMSTAGELLLTSDDGGIPARPRLRLRAEEQRGSLHSNIVYPTLKRFVENGWVTATRGARSAGPDAETVSDHGRREAASARTHGGVRRTGRRRRVGLSPARRAV